jgi:branched-chain amino acid transport system ATP-binding protein
MPLLELQRVAVMRGRASVVRDVTLAVEPGATLALMGRNGSGRTSLLAGLAGLLPVTGVVTCNGTPLARRRPGDVLRAGVALCPEGRGLFPDLSVWDNLLLGAYVLPRAAAEQRAVELASRMPLLAERRRQRAGSLSGGEQQLLAVARACMSRPRVLLLDQPTAGQAPRFRDQVAALIRDVVREGGAVVMAEDDLDFALSVATRIVAMSGGQLAFERRVGPDLDRRDLLDHLLSWELAATPAATADAPRTAIHHTGGSSP